MAFLSMVLLSLTAVVGDAKQITIPLDQVWAWDMPGTHDLRSTKEVRLRQLGQQVAQIIGVPRTKGAGAGAAFAVEGHGREAFSSTYELLTSEKPPSNVFSQEQKVSIFFFTLSNSCYAHVKTVSCKGNEVRIFYQLVPHKTKEVTTHFALIPMPQLAKGSYCVKSEMLPLPEKFLAIGIKKPTAKELAKYVSRPFKFTVGD